MQTDPNWSNFLYDEESQRVSYLDMYESEEEGQIKNEKKSLQIMHFVIMPKFDRDRYYKLCYNLDRNLAIFSFLKISYSFYFSFHCLTLVQAGNMTTILQTHTLELSKQHLLETNKLS